MPDPKDNEKPWLKQLQEHEVAEAVKHVVTCATFIVCCGFMCLAACYVATWVNK